MTNSTSELGRRGFLAAMFGAGAVLVAQPKLLVSRIPILWGDGIHDDTEGLEALFAGRPVKVMSGETFAPGAAPHLTGGSYRVTAPLELGNGTVIERAKVMFEGDLPARTPWIALGRGCALMDSHFDFTRSATECVGIHVGALVTSIGYPTAAA